MITARDQDLKQIRPAIPMLLDEQASSSERFQNTCLRPILKLQYPLIIKVFQTYLEKRKGQFHTLSLAKKADYIKDSIAKDQRLRNLMIGLIAGHFTEKEWQVYSDNEAELRRRLTNLLVQRLQSQLEE